MLTRNGTAVRRSLERWQAAGLLDANTVEQLRAELAMHLERERERFSRLLLATTAAIVLVIAAGTFTAWIWPGLGVGIRCLLMAIVGGALLAAGARLEAGARREVGWLLQASGLGLLALAFGYSGERWQNGRAGGITAGVLALLTGFATFLFFVRRSAVMPAVAVLFSFVFVFVFLVRAFPSGSGDDLVWVLDGLLLLEALLVYGGLRRSPAGWLKGAAGVLLYLAPFLIMMTVAGPLHRRGQDAAWALDAWLIGLTSFLLWLRERSPAPLPAEITSLGLSLSVLIGVGLAFFTTLSAASAPPEVAALAVAGVGGLALLFAVPRGEREVLLTGAVALVVAAWYYAVERGEAMSAFLALAFTGGVLFWVASRVGRAGKSGGSQD